MARDLQPLVYALEDFERSSWEGAVEPGDLLAGAPIELSGSFKVLRRAREVVMAELRRAVDAGSPQSDRLGRIYGRIGDVTSLLTRIKSHRQGEFDFVHTRFEADGDNVNRVEFRRASDRQAASTPEDVYDVWREYGTHPAIEERWGGYLDDAIEAVWEGRHVAPGGGRKIEAPPPTPLGGLEFKTGAETLVGFSATQNEASDPARPADTFRETAHPLVVAPLQFRSAGDRRPHFGGQTSVDARTLWFRNLVERAKKESGARIAAVPINRFNAGKWEEMPVEPLDLPNGRGGTITRYGLVPNSRAAIGDKDLEDLRIDAVLSGVQVQSPVDTARTVVAIWEQLAPYSYDPKEALDRSWRLLAQLVVSGTIQAAGRFRTSATNIVFERANLIELAGFECEELAPSMGGFAGEFAAAFEEIHNQHQRRVNLNQAIRVVRHLRRQPTKAPTRRQFVSFYCSVYGATER